MPRIPVSGQQVQLQQLRGGEISTRADARSFVPEHLEFAKAARSIVSDVAPLIARANANTDNAAKKANVRSAATNALNDMTKLETNIRSKKAGDAINSISDYATAAEEIRKTHLNTLSDDNEREMYASYFEGLYKSGLGQAQAHQERETMAYDKMTKDAHSATLIDRAILYRGTTESNAALEEIKLNVADNLRKEGISDPEVINQKKAEAVDMAQMRIAKAYMSDSPLKALDYVKSVKDTMSATSYENLIGELEGRAKEEKILNKADELAASGLPIEKQLEKISKEKDPEFRDKLSRRVRDNFEQRQMIQNAQAKQIYEGEVDRLFQNPDSYTVPFELDAQKQEHLYELRKKLIADKHGAGKSTNWQIYSKLMSMSDDSFKKVDLNNHLKDLAPSEFKELLKLQREGKSKDLVSPHQQSTLAINGLIPLNDKSEEANLRRNQFYAFVNKELKALPPDKRTPEAINTILQDATAPISKGILWGVNRYRFEAPYLEDSAEADQLLEKTMPKVLDKYPGEKGYEASSGRYFRKSGNFIDYYSKGGTYLGSKRAGE